MFLDDDGSQGEGQELPGAAARAASWNADPQAQALAALEFDAAACAMAVRSLQMGQRRDAFIQSMALYWDQAAKRYVASLAQQALSAKRQQEGPQHEQG